jgi:ferrous iron transport protein B
MSNSSLKIALIGNPNCGKSTLFNGLTGSKQRVANYPGVTVDKKVGYFITKNRYNCSILDLPGTYSMVPRSIDEKITNDILQQDNIDLIFCVMDASNLQNGLRLFFELKELNKPIVIIMNMVDIADRRGYKYNYQLLSQLLGVIIISTNANKKYGISGIIDYIDNNYNKFTQTSKVLNDNIINIIDKRENHIKVAKILEDIKLHEGSPSVITEKLDKFLLHPVFGTIILLAILLLLFQAVFSWASIPKDMLQGCFDFLQNKINTLFPDNIFANLIANGIIAGSGAVITFIPQIAIITLFLILLEDSGYMSRAAFLLDRIMSFAGLNGKSFIPILSSYACAIPAIIATRTIEGKVNRLITI